ncbi:rhodanese-like domain-containing protein [Oceaniglobus indicus]|uniref:rhodanese-like domain-containing protein n=1 Tax=Oceaniglobus indicus TaxID=2047749 RepID=UPI000C19A7C0|nr:rhodanese-like domain-containing protein [Oceaniglobus indicus]
MPIKPVSEMVADAKRRITTLSISDARARVEAGEAVMIDIRDPRELARDGRVPGAIHVPRGMLEFWFDPASPYHRPVLATDKTLILFCAAAARSALSTVTLMEMGFEKVAELEGGFKGWRDSGAPVEPTDPS